jgi:hypothetical protein
MFKIIKKFLANCAKKRSVNLNDKIWIYFENVDDYFKMEVSSVRANCFTARFLSDADWDKSKSMEHLNQYDNDIIIDLKTFKPIKK